MFEWRSRSLTLHVICNSHLVQRVGSGERVNLRAYGNSPVLYSALKIFVILKMRLAIHRRATMVLGDVHPQITVKEIIAPSYDYIFYT